MFNLECLFNEDGRLADLTCQLVQLMYSRLEWKLHRKLYSYLSHDIEQDMFLTSLSSSISNSIVFKSSAEPSRNSCGQTSSKSSALNIICLKHHLHVFHSSLKPRDQSVHTPSLRNYKDNNSA
ncbi:hypothetical protein CEXT_524111 [Caerostris extrusa]|uniref:Uncharacterized protein n=1 Tax=Caerostris extrusa TaxID=172846 RepID=A0AAV4SKN9_CAEEX|nr:hypothetical protein CEXT_524111 [Caerostris extrusa]